MPRDICMIRVANKKEWPAFQRLLDTDMEYEAYQAKLEKLCEMAGDEFTAVPITLDTMRAMLEDCGHDPETSSTDELGDVFTSGLIRLERDLQESAAIAGF